MPSRSIISTAIDRAWLVAGKDRIWIPGMTCQRPDTQCGLRRTEPAPGIAGVVASPDAIVSADGDPARASGIGKNREDMRGRVNPGTQRFPGTLSVEVSIETSTPEPARVCIS